MDGIAELLREIRLISETAGLRRWELYGVFLIGLGVWRLPVLLKHKRQMEVIRSDFAMKNKRLEAKIEKQNFKRKRKAKREG